MSETDESGLEPKATEVEETAEENGEPEELVVSGDDQEPEEGLSVNEVEAALNKAQQELDDWRARAYRGAADLENARRRFQREREDLQKYGTESLLKELISVVDNLERALGHDTGGQALVEGVQMVLRQFMQVVERVGATPFDPKGEEFDPQFHEAMSQFPSADVAPGTIIEVFQRGWKLHDRLVRPAMVIVATEMAPEAGDGAEQGSEKDENYESKESQPKDEAPQASEG